MPLNIKVTLTKFNCLRFEKGFFIFLENCMSKIGCHGDINVNEPSTRPDKFVKKSLSSFMSKVAKGRIPPFTR